MNGLRAVVAGMACLLVLAAAARAAAPVTYANDAARTGWYPDQPTLSPQSVVSSSFGQLWSTPVDGQVYAQPLLSNGTLFVATENNWIYGMDPRTGAVRWQRNVGEAFDPTSFCGDLVPRIGVTGTPVIDPDTGTAYFFSKTYTTDSGGTKSPAWFAHAVDMTNGDERSGFPVKIEGDAENAPGTPFSANTEGQRPGLLLMNGVVYAGFAGHCDQFDFRGWIVGVSTSGHITTMWTSRPLPGTGAGIWQSGGGLVSDGSDQILFATGNGGAPTPPMAGNTPPSSLGESVVRLGVQPGRNLRATDFFAPYDGAQLDGWDADLGSGAPVALPDSFGTSKVRRLLVQPGKEGYVYLLNRDSLGGTGQGPGGGDAVVDRIGPYGGAWSHPAVWPGDGGYVYIPTASSGFVPGTGLLRAYKRGVDASNEPTLSLAGSSTDGFGFGSGAPVVSSDGTTTGSAVVWTIWSPDGSGAGAQLRAYSPVPDANQHLTPIGTWPIGTATKFPSPGVAAGRVYVGTRDGTVKAFGSPVTQAVTGPSVTFGSVPVGSSATKTATFTATRPLRIDSIATGASSAFSVNGSTSPAVPATLSTGDTISVPIRFAPTTPGTAGGTLTMTLDDASTVRFGLAGDARAAGPYLSMSSPAVSFGSARVSETRTESLTFTNQGSQTLTINSIAGPGTPFTLRGTPVTVPPGEAITAQIDFTPPAPGFYSDDIEVDSDGGNADVGVSGAATGNPHLVIDPPSIDFGSVPPGEERTATFTIRNAGAGPATIMKSKPPTGPFSALTALFEGNTIPAGASTTETIRFRPDAAGPASSAWAITGDDDTGPHSVVFTGAGGSAASPLPGLEALIPGAAIAKLSRLRARPSRLHGSARRLRVHFALDLATKLRTELDRVGKSGRYRRLGKTFTLNARSGKNAVRLPRRLRMRRLVPGLYAVRLTPPGGATRRVLFRVRP